MTQRASLRCRCGTVRGYIDDASSESGTRAVCYCDDCQTFAYFLESSLAHGAARFDVGDVLDGSGGTDIYQVASARVVITDGADELCCVRLSPKGLYRYYAGCCRTPVGNTLSARVPFVGVVHSFMDHRADGVSRDQALGRPVGYIQARFAKGAVPPEAHPKVSLSLIARSLRLLSQWWLKGLAKPSPFFDSASKQPRVTPQVLSKAERATLRRKVADEPRAAGTATTAL
jgi:hypothetical protein